MEKVLDYHEAQCPQETSYWCGPASTEMVLSCQGIDEYGLVANIVAPDGNHGSPVPGHANRILRA